MRRLFIILAAGCLGATWETSLCAATPLESVQGIEQYDGPDSGRALLATNGFVAIPRFYHRIFGPYLHSPLPPFITADSVHCTFHVIFEESLKEFEASSYEKMREIIKELGSVAEGVPTGSAEADTLLLNYLRVTQCLLEDQEPSAQPEAVASELTRIHAAGGIQQSAVFGYPMDYSQFKPRGFYTESKELRCYFKAMTWLGCAAFRLKSDTETIAAMRFADILRRSKAAREAWRTLDTKYTQLLFQCDDLTIEEYTAVLDAMMAVSSALPALEDFRKHASALRNPRYNDIVLDPAQQANWVEETKGLRFMGRRYLPDGSVFDKVTLPKVPARMFPSGLDVLAANGSVQARKHLESELTKDPAYAAGMEKATQDLSEDKAAFANSHYIKVMRVLECLTAPPHEKAAPFARTDAYADKNMMTALGAWASMRHAWILHAKQNMVTLGAEIEEPLSGYIEPNPAFFDAMIELGESSVEIFGVPQQTTEEPKPRYGYQAISASKRMQHFVDFVKMIRTLLTKQLEQQGFTQNEKMFFTRFADALVGLQGNATNSPNDSAFPWMALVADVFSESATEQCLEVATGGAMPIYAIVPHAQQVYLVLGAMYSYYEFRQPMANRLTDEDWRAQWDRGQIPELPAWSASFTAQSFDVDKIIESIKNGKVPQETATIQDPRLNEYLLSTIQSEDFQDMKRLMRNPVLMIAARKFPEEMRTILTKHIREMAPPDFEGNNELRAQMEQPDFDIMKHKQELDAFVVARGQLMGLSMLLDACWAPSILDELTKFAQLSPNHAQMALFLTMSATDKAVEGFWRKTLRESTSVSIKDACVLQIGLRGSKDVLPDLVDSLASAEGAQKTKTLAAVARVLIPSAEEAMPSLPRFKSLDEKALDESQEAILRAALNQAFEEEIAAGGQEKRMRSRRSGLTVQTIRLAYDLKMPDIIPRIAECVSKGAWESHDALGIARQLPKQQAFDLCVALLPLTDATSIWGIAEVFVSLGDARALPYLRNYLNDTTPTRLNGLRVCDHACVAMEQLLGVKRPVGLMPFEDGPERDKLLKDFDARRFAMLERTKNPPSS